MFDLTTTANDVLARLGVVSWADLNWATQDEVYGYFDEASLRLAEMGLWVYLETLTVLASTPQYVMPYGWLDSIHITMNGYQLRPTSVAELEALDSTWTQTQCAPNASPTRYSMDAGPLGTITLYPVPAIANETLTSIDHCFNPTVTAASPMLPICSVIADYFLYFALQRLRGKESPYQMLDMAQSFAQQGQLYEAILTSYYGSLANP